jgi:LPXTG-site transpeptidase (sortase) family protein
MSVLLQSLTKTPLFLRVVALYIIAGAFIWGGSHLAAIQKQNYIVASAAAQSTIMQAKDTTKASVKTISGSPVHITVPRLNIDLPVSNGYFDKKTGQWTLGNGAAYFATITDLPNDQHGSTFIYGHNNKSAFGPFANIAVGDIVSIKTSNDHTLSYVYSHDEKVSPDTTKILFETSDKPRLVLMTCDGIWSNFRRVMYFDFKEAL